MLKSYYDRWLEPKSFEGITRQESEKLKGYCRNVRKIQKDRE